MGIISRQETWQGFRAKLLEMFAHQHTAASTVKLLKSLVKGPGEDCHHFVIRVCFVARLLLSSCQCPNVGDELAISLFYAGLGDWERELCLQTQSSLEEYANMLNG